MDHNKAEFEYGKWDSPEDTTVAFQSVQTGVWDLARFEKWVKKVECEVYRDATANEDM